MIDIENYIARRYRERVFAELTPTDFNEILLDQIDELHSPIKIGPLEFKASEIIKQLRPDALENYEIKSELLGAEGRKNFDWYTSILENNEYSYCWLENPDMSFASDFNFFKYEDCHRIMKEVKDDFLQQFKNDLLQENKDLLQKVMKELLGGKKFDNPIEIEIYSEDKSGRKFLNSNGEQSFRAVETPEPQVVKTPEPQVVKTPDYEKKIMTPREAFYYARDVLHAPFPEGEATIATSVECSFAYARDVLKAPFPLGEAAIATNVECSYLYAKDILKAPFPLGETAIATAGSYSYGYAKNVLKAPFPLGEKAIATNGYYIEIYKELFPETQVAPAQTQAQATSMSDKQKEAIKDSFEILLYSLGEWIEFDEQDSSYPACFCSESIMDNIDHLLEAFPDICKDLAVKKYSEVKSYMDEYSKDRDEKENRV